MVQYEWQYEFFNESEDTEVRIASDLIENAFLLFGKKRQRLRIRQRLGHERLREVEAFLASDDVFNAPVNALRRRQGRLV